MRQNITFLIIILIVNSCIGKILEDKNKISTKEQLIDDEFSHLSVLMDEKNLIFLYNISQMFTQIKLKLVIPNFESFTFQSSETAPKVRFKEFSSSLSNFNVEASKMTIYDNVIKLSIPMSIENMFKVLYKAHPKKDDVDDDPEGAKVDDKCFVTYTAALEILIKMEIQVTNYILAINVSAPFLFDKSETTILDSEEKKVFNEGLIALLKEQSNWSQTIADSIKDIIHSYYNQNKEMILFKNIEISNKFIYSFAKLFTLNIKPSSIPSSINNKYMKYKLKGLILEKPNQEKLNIEHNFDISLYGCQVFISYHLLNNMISFNNHYLMTGDIILDDYIKGISFERNIEVLGLFLPEVYYYFSRLKKIKISFKINQAKIITNKYKIDKISEENLNVFKYPKQSPLKQDDIFLKYDVSMNVYLANSEILLLNVNVNLLSEIVILAVPNAKTERVSDINFKLGKAYLLDYNTDNHSGEVDVSFFESFFMNNFNNFLEKNPQYLFEEYLPINYDIKSIKLTNNGLVILGDYFLR